MGKQYRHLSSEERAVIQIEHGNGSSLRAIAQRLGRIHDGAAGRHLNLFAVNLDV